MATQEVTGCSPRFRRSSGFGRWQRRGGHETSRGELDVALNATKRSTRCAAMHVQRLLLTWCGILSLACTLQAQGSKQGYFLDPTVLALASIIPPPDPNATVRELAMLHQIEASRTKEQVAAAQADEADQTIFAYRTVLGPGFAADKLPLTAALSAHVHSEEAAASDSLKLLFARPRPYQLDKTLHPVCKVGQAPNSYPSGHGLSGHLLSLTLAEMVPEKQQQIFARADDYARNRLVCGVHYPSDLRASRRIAYLLFGAMMANPRFASDLAAARVELRTQLGLGKLAR